MKNLKKLVIASFMLVIAFVAVVSSTYAWFTSSSNAKVNDITIGVVDAAKSLLISKDAGEHWGRSVDYSFKGKYTPVTIDTHSGTNFYELDVDDYLNAYYKNATLLSEQGQTTDEGYVKLDLRFQVDAKDDNLSNTKIKVQLINVHAFDATDLDAAKATQNGSITSENGYALSSFRVAFAENGESITRVIEANRTLVDGETQGLYGSGNQFRLENAWMERYAATPEHIIVGEAQDSAVTGYVSKGKYVTKGNDCYTLDNKDAVYTTNGVLQTWADETVEFEISKFYTTVDCSAEATLANVRTAYAHVVIYVWMEGWDGDCENVASGCFYRFGLSFEVE